MVKFQYISNPESTKFTEDQISILTYPETDFWQRTYYGFQKTNASFVMFNTDEQRLSFKFKAEFEYAHTFDQCGAIIYLDDENWVKASVEFEKKGVQKLGSVVTNLGYSDWASFNISPLLKKMWYKIIRYNNDFIIFSSKDGILFQQI